MRYNKTEYVKNNVVEQIYTRITTETKETNGRIVKVVHEREERKIYQDDKFALKAPFSNEPFLPPSYNEVFNHDWFGNNKKLLDW